MTYSKVLYAAGIAAVAAGGANIEFTSSNLVGGGDRGIESVKGVISTDVSLPGLGDANIELNYDTNPMSDDLGGITDVSVSGSFEDISYELTRSDDATDLTLTTDVSDLGTVTVDVDVRASEVTSVSIERDLDMGDQTVTVTPSYNPGSGKSKLSLSTVLGSGVTADVTIDDLADAQDTSVEISYESDLGDGRTLTATIDPMGSTGEVEIVDSDTFDFTTTLKVPLGGDPELSIKRSFNFF